MDSKPLGVCETLSMVFFFFLKSHCILSLSYGIKYLYVSMVSLVITGEKDLACSLVCNEYGEKNRTFDGAKCPWHAIKVLFFENFGLWRTG